MSLPCPEDQDLLIMGGTGNLARSKLLPALFDLSVEGLLPPHGLVVGCARRAMTDDEYRDLVREAVEANARHAVDAREWDAFAGRLRYFSLAKRGLASVRDLCEQDRRLVYLALPPHLFESTIEELGEARLSGGSRLVLEKPLGNDLASSRRLQATIDHHFREDQVFRIDHFLGKETVQNLLVFRFGNAVFERVWCREAIDHVQITVAESKGIDGRGEFYDGVGAVRDIVQNHVLQMLALLAMDRPSQFRASPIHDEKVRLLSAVSDVDPSNVVLGQYAANGEDTPGYLQEPGVAEGSRTETYAAMRLSIENERWAGVPFHIRTGKRLPRRTTEFHIAFRRSGAEFFESAGAGPVVNDHLTMNIQPRQSIALTFLAKRPGPRLDVQPVDMEFAYHEDDGSPEPIPAYERLIHDVMCGDQTHFTRGDAVDRAWQIVQPLLDAPPQVQPYPAFTWGPEAARELVAPREWHLH